VLGRDVGDVLPLAGLAASVQDDGRCDAREGREGELAPLEREALDLYGQLRHPVPEPYRSPSQ